MDPITLTLRATKGSALTHAEEDANKSTLKTAIEQVDEETIKTSDASPIADLEGAVADTDLFIGLRAGVPYKAPMTELPGGAMAAADIRDALETLTGANRLDASAIQNLPATGYDSAAEVRDALASLTGSDRLDASSVKNLPTLSPGDPVTVTHDGAGEDPVVGDTLTANFATGWSGSVQWLRDGSPISGATSATYLLVEADEGAQVAPEVTGLEFTAPAVTVAAPAATAPAAFTSGQWTATAGTEQIAVDITALPSDGGSAITELQYRLDGGSPVAFSGTGTGVRNITGLTGGVEYDVEIRAVNAVGAGAWSDLKARTPSAASSGPEIVAVQYTAASFGDNPVANVPAGAQEGDRLLVVFVTGTSVTSVGGGYANITPSAATSSDGKVYLSDPIVGTPPSTVTIALGGNASLHVRVAVLRGAGAAVVDSGSLTGAGGVSADPRAHPYTTTGANRAVFGMLNFGDGGVTGLTGQDSEHGWSFSTGVGGYEHMFYTERAAADTYSATVGPDGAASSSGGWWMALGAA